MNGTTLDVTTRTVIAGLHRKLGELDELIFDRTEAIRRDRHTERYVHAAGGRSLDQLLQLRDELEFEIESLTDSMPEDRDDFAREPADAEAAQ